MQHIVAGIIQPFRNLGGMFDLGWPHLGETLVEAVGRGHGLPRSSHQYTVITVYYVT